MDKKCTVCNEEYPATTEFFHISRQSKDGLKPNCKHCENERLRKYYKKNKKEKKVFRPSREQMLKEAKQQAVEARERRATSYREDV